MKGGAEHRLAGPSQSRWCICCSGFFPTLLLAELRIMCNMLLGSAGHLKSIPRRHTREMER
eukprot:364002-Chlamydomonas_euryale.AAC.4